MVVLVTLGLDLNMPIFGQMNQDVVHGYAVVLLFCQKFAFWNSQTSGANLSTIRIGREIQCLPYAGYS